MLILQIIGAKMKQVEHQVQSMSISINFFVSDKFYFLFIPSVNTIKLTK